MVETPLLDTLKMPQKVRKTPTFVVKVGVFVVEISGIEPLTS